MTSIKELSIDGIPVRDSNDDFDWIKFGGGQFGTQWGYPVAPGFIWPPVHSDGEGEGIG